MTGLRAIASRWLPPLVLMAVIFWLSAQPGLNSGFGVWDTVLRKLAHMVEFGLLWFLWWRALGYGSPLPSVAITLAYAATDELHQTLVPDRAGSPFDWAIDAAGVGLAGITVLLWTRLRGSRTRRERLADHRAAPERRGA
jgi:hypothetical protein